MAEMNGRCLCGAVRFRVAVSRPEVDACHCSMCRRWAGGPVLAIMADGQPSFESEEAVGVYRSSDWGERLFCRTCGSSLLWRSADRAHAAVPAGLLDAPGELSFTAEIFIDDKPGWYAFAGERTRMTGAEVVAAFAGGDAGQGSATGG